MTPSVGRIVHYQVADGVEQGMNNGAPVAPAVITRVWGPSVVNLKVFLDGHCDIHVTSVQVAPPDVSPNPSRSWYWPPRVE